MAGVSVRWLLPGLYLSPRKPGGWPASGTLSYTISFISHAAPSPSAWLFLNPKNLPQSTPTLDLQMSLPQAPVLSGRQVPTLEKPSPPEMEEGKLEAWGLTSLPSCFLSLAPVRKQPPQARWGLGLSQGLGSEYGTLPHFEGPSGWAS